MTFRAPHATADKSVTSKTLRYSPWISTKSGVVQSVETIVVREGDVCGMVQQQSQHVIPFLRNRVVKRSVAFGVLETENGFFLVRAEVPRRFIRKRLCRTETRVSGVRTKPFGPELKRTPSSVNPLPYNHASGSRRRV